MNVGQLKQACEGLHDSSPVLLPAHGLDDHYFHPPASVAQETVRHAGGGRFAEHSSEDDFETRQALVIR